MKEIFYKIKNYAKYSNSTFLPTKLMLEVLHFFSAASFPCSSSCATLLDAAAQGVASLSLIITCGALGAHRTTPLQLY